MDLQRTVASRAALTLLPALLTAAQGAGDATQSANNNPAPAQEKAAPWTRSNAGTMAGSTAYQTKKGTLYYLRNTKKGTRLFDADQKLLGTFETEQAAHEWARTLEAAKNVDQAKRESAKREYEEWKKRIEGEGR